MSSPARPQFGQSECNDLASVLLALGSDALAVTERLPDELPAHHPMMDARQSARQLAACLKGHNAVYTTTDKPGPVA